MVRLVLCEGLVSEFSRRRGGCEGWGDDGGSSGGDWRRWLLVAGRNGVVDSLTQGSRLHGERRVGGIEGGGYREEENETIEGGEGVRKGRMEGRWKATEMKEV